MLDEGAQILVELGGGVAFAEDEQEVVELVEAFAQPGVEDVVASVVGLGGAVDVGKDELTGAEEGELEELGGDHGGQACLRGGLSSHRWLRLKRRGGRSSLEEGCEVMLEAEVAAVALEEEVELAVDAKTEGDALT